MTPESILSLAAEHGLRVRPESLRLEEAGLDYRVAFGRDETGLDWVLRLPRRPALRTKMQAEARVLAFLSPRLPVAVPEWRICSDSLIAYPRLPGEPGLTLDPESGEPHFHLPPDSENYARSLGAFLARLHAVSPEEALTAGVEPQSPEGLRAEWRRRLEDVSAAFPVSSALKEGWLRWLDTDALWPRACVFTHGELYPAHVLVDARHEIRSVLDWTTAALADPALDFAYQHFMAGPAAFALTVEAYEAARGEPLEHLAGRCAALMAAAPLQYGLFALETGEPAHLESARALLNPAD